MAKRYSRNDSGRIGECCSVCDRRLYVCAAAFEWREDRKHSKRKPVRLVNQREKGLVRRLARWDSDESQRYDERWSECTMSAW